MLNAWGFLTAKVHLYYYLGKKSLILISRVWLGVIPVIVVLTLFPFMVLPKIGFNFPDFLRRVVLFTLLKR